MHSLLVYQDGVIRAEFPLEEIGRTLANPNYTVWLDIQDPDEADIALLRDALAFHPLAIEDAIRAHERPKVDAYSPASESGPGSHYYSVVFYTAAYDPTQDHIETRPLHLFIGPNYLVTVHHGVIRHISETQARWQAPGSPLGSRVGSLVYALLDAIVDDYFPIMDQVAERVEDLEDTIFVHFDERAIETIFGLKRDLLNLRRVVAPERDVLNVLLRRELPIFKARDTVYFQDIYDHIVRVTDSIDTYRDLLSSALDSYLSLQSNNLNQVMKLLTMASIVLMSSALVAGIYGMNFRFMPELNQPWGYPFALGLMALISLLLVLYFRRKGWL
jgi:magnesium transporter